MASSVRLIIILMYTLSAVGLWVLGMELLMAALVFTLLLISTSASGSQWFTSSLCWLAEVKRTWPVHPFKMPLHDPNYCGCFCGLLWKGRLSLPFWVLRITVLLVYCFNSCQVLWISFVTVCRSGNDSLNSKWTQTAFLLSRNAKEMSRPGLISHANDFTAIKLYLLWTKASGSLFLSCFIEPFIK